MDAGIPICSDIATLIRTGVSIKDRLRIGMFLGQCGWYDPAQTVLSDLTSDPATTPTQLHHALTHSAYLAALDYNFSKAQLSLEKAGDVVDGVGSRALSWGITAYRYYCVSQYDEASVWAEKALVAIDDQIDTKSCILLLRLLSKVYINTRKFCRAECLVSHAVNLSLVTYSPSHPEYAAALQDYGFCLLHLDRVEESVTVS
eukprot:sb/3470617/